MSERLPKPSVSERVSTLEREGLVLALLLSVWLAWPLRHYVTDDTYIHLRYAHQLAHGEGFVFNTGERVYGTTSPLWVLLLAYPMSLGIDGLLASKLLGAAATLATLLLWWALVRRTLASPWLRACSTVAWAAHAWMLRWSLSGMETPLATCLVLAGCVAFTARQPWGARAGLASVLWALAGLTRPECALLLPLWALLLVFDHGRAGVGMALRGLWPGAVVLGGWLAFAWGWFGRLLPNTLAAKAAGGEGLAYHLEQLARQAGIVGATDAAVALTAVVLVAWRLARREAPPLRPTTRFLPWVWMVAVPLLYMARGVPVLSRYLVPLLPLIGWLGWALLDRALARATPGVLRAAGATLAVLALAQNLFMYEKVVRPQVQSFTAGMRGGLEPWGRWFAVHSPVDAVIAAPDIGAIGYLSQRRVVDLAGLVTPAMVPILRRVSPEDAVARFEFMKFSRPDYVVDRADSAWDLERRSRWTRALTRIGTATLPNLGVARPAPVVYSFYRIEWSVVDSIATSHRDR